MTAPELATRLRLYRVLPTLQIYADDEADAAGSSLKDLPAIIDLLVEAQYPAVELLHRSSATWEALTLIRRQAPQLSIGVGTLCTLADMKRARDAGAHFGVSPGLSPSLVRDAADANWPYLPGISTASEVMQAQELGLSCAKFFPAAALGAAYLQQLAAPFPSLSWVPSGGLRASNYQDFAQLPSVACVSGSWMLPSPAVLRPSTRAANLSALRNFRESLASTPRQK